MGKANGEITLGPFRVDFAGTELFRGDRRLELRPQAFRVLELLIRNHGKVVEYDRMMREAWGFQVSRHTVATTVNELKNVLGEYGSWITCQSKFGYRLTIRESEELLRKGWHFWNQQTLRGFENALECFEQAASKDSSDFRPWAAISSTCLMLAGFLLREPRDCRVLFEEAHGRAVGLCGLTAELRLDRAFGLFIFEQNLAAAESELLALRRESTPPVDAPIRLGLVYLASGRLDDAYAAMLEAQAIDDLAPQAGMLAIIVRLFRGDFAAAEECGRKLLELYPGSPASRAFYAEALEGLGRPEQALAEYKLALALSPDAFWILADEAGCLARNGRPDEASALLEQLQGVRRSAYVDAYHLALALAALGRREEAFQELGRALNEMAYSLLFIDLDAKASQIRRDPRFDGFRQKVYRGRGVSRPALPPQKVAGFVSF